jgi:hypothetical protein
MTALETQEMTSGMGLSLEPPLSPPVVRSSASPEPHSKPDLAMPVPALRLPETTQEPEPLMAPQPIEPITAAPEPEPEPLPAMAPVEPEAQPEATPLIPVNFPPAPTPAPEPEPEPAELPEIAPLTLTPPAPTPAEPPAAETEAPAELPVIDPFRAAPAVAPMPSPPAEPALLEQLAHSRGGYRVVVRLNDGHGVDVGEFKDFGTAMEGAQEVIEQFTNADGSWPFYAGRFIRPDLIVSVDVVDA